MFFIINSVFLGFGLAMDAFSISVANSMRETGMTVARKIKIAGVFAFFQALMPVAGWICINTITEYFQVINRYIPWIALAVLSCIGIKMIVEGIKDRGEDDDVYITSDWLLFAQGIATSIDALAAGFSLAGHDTAHALMAALIIAAVTFVICMLGLKIGEKAGIFLASKAPIAGGIILIIIGIEIVISG